MLTAKEIHNGVITKIMGDYTYVNLTTPKGDKYERFFTTEDLKACGIEQEGDQFNLIFDKRIDKDSKTCLVCMLIKKDEDTEGQSTDTLAQQIEEIMDRIDLEKIQAKFSPNFELRNTRLSVIARGGTPKQSQ